MTSSSGAVSKPPFAVAVAAAAAAGVATAATGATWLRYGNDLVGRTPTVHAPGAAVGWERILTVGTSVLCLAAMWRPVSRPLVTTGFAVLLAGALIPTWADSPVLGPPLRVVVSSAWPLTIAGVAMIALSWRRPDKGTRRRLAIIATVAVLAAMVGALGDNPFDDPACAVICRDVSAPLDRFVSTPHALMVAAVLALGACALTAASLRRIRPTSIASSAVAATICLGIVSTRAVTARSAFVDAPRSLTAIAVGVMGLAALWTAARTARVRRTVERLVAELVAGAEAVAVQFAMPAGGSWIDSEGRPVPAGADKGPWLVLDDLEGPAVRLAIGAAPHGHAALDRMTGATRLALDNARLAAIGRAQVRVVRRSQQRIVATFDDERRRIERDLHDGAQQRLVSVAFKLSAARTWLGTAELARAEASVSEALERLRDLTHGLFPSALAHEGIRAALEDLIADGDVSATLDVELDEEIGLHAATAVYEIAQHVLTSARAPVRIRVTSGAGAIQVLASARHSTVAVGSALRDVRDRVEAIGGSLAVLRTDEAALDVTAVIPCAWS